MSIIDLALYLFIAIVAVGSAVGFYIHNKKDEGR